MLTPDKMSKEAFSLYERVLHTDIIACHKYDLNSRVERLYPYMEDTLPDEYSGVNVTEDEIDS